MPIELLKGRSHEKKTGKTKQCNLHLVRGILSDVSVNCEFMFLGISINLSIEGRLFVCLFGLFVTLRSSKLLTSLLLHSWYFWTALNEKEGCTQMVSQCLRRFRLTMQELLNIEQFCPWKFSKIKTKTCLITTLESSQWVKL